MSMAELPKGRRLTMRDSPFTLDEIVAAACALFNTTRACVFHKHVNRNHHEILTRELVIASMRKFRPDWSYPDVSRRLGHATHSTIHTQFIRFTQMSEQVQVMLLEAVRGRVVEARSKRKAAA